MFSQFARKLLFFEIIKTYLQHLYKTSHTPYFFHFIHDFRECSHNSLVEKGFYNF